MPAPAPGCVPYVHVEASKLHGLGVVHGAKVKVQEPLTSGRVCARRATRPSRQRSAGYVRKRDWATACEEAAKDAARASPMNVTLYLQSVRQSVLVGLDHVKLPHFVGAFAPGLST